MKRFATLLLALVMILSLATTAFAAGENTITVTGAQKGETYNIYKMLNVAANEDKTAFTYTVTEEWNDFFTDEGAGTEYVYLYNDQVNWKDGASASAKEAFAKAAAAYAVESGASVAAAAITPEADGDIIFENLEDGYYLITSTNGTLAMIETTPADTNVVVAEKNQDPTVEKEVNEDNYDGEYDSANDAQIGETVEFRVTMEVKKGASNYVLHDKMSDGLTFDPTSVKAYIVVGEDEKTELVADEDYVVVTENLTDGCTFEIRAVESVLDTVGADFTMEIYYNAILNEKAIVSDPETNDVHLTWGENGRTEVSTTLTRTYQFTVMKYNKTDGPTKIPLAGAIFELRNTATNELIKLVKVSETEYRVANGDEEGAVDSFITVAEGPIVISGVDLDSYQLIELEAPAGYNKLSWPVQVVVSSDNNLVVDVHNSAGTELPSTGGMGTTLFYTLGGIMVLAAVILLVTKKRMSAA